MNANEWKEKLYLQKKNGGLVLSEEELQKADAFCEEYKNFLNSSKTEREAVHYAVARAEKLGFTEYCRKPKLRTVRGQQYDGLTFRKEL